MALRSRDELNRLTDDIGRGIVAPVYLCFGERFLCQQAAEQIAEALLSNGGGTVHAIDGATEDPGKTISRLQSFSLLPGRQIYRVSDSRLFLSRAVGADLWERAFKARQEQKPDAAARYLASLLALAFPSATETAAFAELSAAQWRDLFGFEMPADDRGWADALIAERQPAWRGDGKDSAERLVTAIERGFAQRTILLLVAEHIDKRKRLFSCIRDKGEIIDCSVAEGSGRAAQDAQRNVIREMAQNTAASFDKTIDAKTLELVFDRIGFHPVAVVMEVEKLALFVGDRNRITRDDIEQLVGRTREDAIFELTEALSSRLTSRALIVLSHLLHDNVHDLAIIAAIRNLLRRLLVFRCLQLQPSPAWHPAMSAKEFQADYLPALKQTDDWSELLKGHPYGLYMSFKKASGWTLASLKANLRRLLEAEDRLKGAGTALPPRIVMEELIVTITGS